MAAQICLDSQWTEVLGPSSFSWKEPLSQCYYLGGSEQKKNFRFSTGATFEKRLT